MMKTTTESFHEAAFRALAHPVRRRILDYLFENPGSTVGTVAAQFESSRIAVMKHLRTLEEARLVLSQKKGRERLLYFNPVPLQEIADHWRTRYASAWSTRLLDLKSRIEGKSADPDRVSGRHPVSDSPSRREPADSLSEEPS